MKYRGVDDGAFALTSLTYQAVEVVSLMPWTFTAAVAHRMFQLHTERGERVSQLGSLRRDETNAYHNVASREPELHERDVLILRPGRRVSSGSLASPLASRAP